MSEIKTILNFFDKNNGLDAILKDLKEVKKLQAEINNQKGAVGSDNLKERAAALKEITRLQKQLATERKKSSKAGKEAVGVEKELINVQKQEEKIQNQLIVGRTKAFRQLQEAKILKQQQTKAVKDEVKETSKLVSLYDKESAKLNRLRKNLKNLILTEGEGSKKTKQLALEVGKLDAKLKKADAAAGQFQRNVGNYPKGLKGAIGALKNFAGALGITAGIAGLVRGIGNAVNIFKDFEQGNANLAAVLGKTKSEIGTLTEDAKRLGATTAFTASQVSGLQVEFAKLGFNEQEILNATEATLSLAAATGSDLGEAAAIAGATLGGFGLGAEETQRVVDVMAKSFSTSALDIEKFKESMKNAAPAAKAVGISVEETTALLGTLANAGISGSRAGNSLKTSFINLNKAGLTLEEGLEKVANSEDKLGTAAKLVGKNAAASFLVLSEGVDVTKELTIGLNNAGGAAKKMADEQLDTLTGSMTKLSSAWEGFILSLEDGQGTFATTIRAIIDVVTELFSMAAGVAKAKDELNETQLALRETAETIIKVGKVIGILITSFIAYKVAVVASNIATKAYTFVTTALRVAKIALSRGTNIATIAMKAFNLATKANPIGLLIALVTAAAGAFFFFRDEQDKSTESTVRFTAAQSEAIDAIKERLKITESAGKIFKKLLKDETAYLGGFSDAQIKSTILEAKRIAIKKKGTAQAQVAIRILNKLEDEQQRRKKEIDELDGRNDKKKKKKLTQAEKDAEKKRLAEIEMQRKRLKILDDIEIRAIEDATEKKKALRSQAFEEKIYNLERDGTITAEIEKALTQELQDDLTKIEVDAELERQAILKTEHDKLMAELEKQAAEEIALDKKKKAEEAKLAEEVAAAKKEQQQEVIAQSKEAVDFALDELTRESEAKIEALDRQINAEQDFLSQNENLSAREIEFRREKAAELEAERIKEQQRLERLAKTQAFFDLVAAFASSGDGQGAVGKAASAMVAAEAISGGFHDGGYTGDGNEYDSAGVVHKGEFVNTKAQTTEYGMKGWRAKDFDNAISDGYFNQFSDSGIFADQNAKFLSVQSNEVGYDFGRLENEIKSVKDAIGNIQSSDFAIQDGYFIKTKKSKGNTLITKKKLG